MSPLFCILACLGSDHLSLYYMAFVDILAIHYLVFLGRYCSPKFPLSSPECTLGSI